MARDPLLGQIAVPGMLIMDPISPMSLIGPLLKAIASIVKDPAQRHPLYIKTLKRFGLDPKHPPSDFDSVYAYTLIEYVLTDEEDKSEALLTLFAESEIKSAFHQAFNQWDSVVWNRSIEQRLDWRDFGNEWNFVGNAIRDQNVDVQREATIFFTVFLNVVRRSQTTAQHMQTMLLTNMQQELKQELRELRSQLQQTTEQMTGRSPNALPALPECEARDLAEQVDAWFQALNYGRESYERIELEYWEWIITIPARRGYDRILVRCIAGEAGIAQMQELRQIVKECKPDEGWIISNRRVASAVKDALETREYRDLYCYTLDEVIDQVADFKQYLTWLENEITQKGIDTDYIPLGCSKDEVDPKTHQKIGVSYYGEEEGWIEGYVDQWLADSSKEHLSVLGEFGTGKTWFALRYAWLALQNYKQAKAKGVRRPRLPLVIPLRDYAKAVSAESLFSEFFFRKHQIPLPGYDAFEQLNRMGKLLLIFDGFDEMAARINQQSMIDNFWELAKVVVPGAKAILTCRTEHFPEAVEGRKLLNAELQASTKNLTGEPPQFEVLELAKFSDEQIAELLGRKANPKTVDKVIGNQQLLDLARRPVMVELILEALPEIEQEKPIDMARIYLYAVTRKMRRDITSERTFTSLADKLYFLCELSWEMLSTDRMSLNYRAFPERLERLFDDRVKEEKELDHWRYDMMGQTMLIRNSEGDYSPAHRSLLEFFAAYKIVASLGAMAEDFTAVAREQSYLDTSVPPQAYTWDGYFRRRCDGEGTPQLMAQLGQFESMTFNKMLPLLRQSKLAKAILDLAYPMLDRVTMKAQVLPLIQSTRHQMLDQIGYLGSNLVHLLLANDHRALEQSDLSETTLLEPDFTQASLRGVDLSKATLHQPCFTKVLGSVWAVDISPDGELLAVGDSNGIVQIWRIKTWQLLHFCKGHRAGINTMVFSPDGERLASGSDDKSVKLWSSGSGKCLNTLEGHQDWVRSVVFSSDGERLASGSGDKCIKLWSSGSGECLNTLEGHQASVCSVVFSSDGERLASGSDDKCVKLWSSDSGECLNTLEGHQSRVLSVVFSPDGERLASGSTDNSVKVWSSGSGECLTTLKGHQDWVNSVVFSPDGERLASGSGDKRIKLWSSSTGECLATLEGHQSSVRSVIFSPDGERLASGSLDSSVKLWSSGSGECLNNLEGHQPRVISVVFSPDGKRLASGIADKRVKLWSSGSGECLNTLEGHQSSIFSVVFSPDGERLASSGAENSIKLWSSGTGECLNTLEGHQSSVCSVVFSPNGERLASGSDDKSVKLWSSGSGECLATLEGHQSRVLSVVFSPDGACLASGSADHSIKLWSSGTGECLNTLEGHQDWVRSVVFSPDGERLASGSGDNSVKLWSSDSGECLNTLEGHQSRVCSVVFSPDGERLASGSMDNSVKLWLSSSGECLQTLEGHQDWVRSVVFSPDGERLASGSEDKTIRVWDVATGKCLLVLEDDLCLGLDITGTRGLTEAQRTALKLMGAVERF